MKNSKQLIVGNAILWVIAALIYPVSQWLPTSSGAPPKIYDVLVPIFVLALGFASTSFLRTALKGSHQA